MNKSHHSLLPLALVSATVVLQLAAAWLLSAFAAVKPAPALLAAGMAVFAAIVLNVLRFLIWGYAHKRFPLSETYPLTALFFPCILLLSYLRGNPVVIFQLTGTVLITVGAFVMAAAKPSARVDSP